MKPRLYAEAPDGRILTAREISDETGINVITLRLRMKRGMKWEKLVKPADHLQTAHIVKVDGIWYCSIIEMCRHYGVPTERIARRVRAGVPMDMALAWEGIETKEVIYNPEEGA